MQRFLLEVEVAGGLARLWFKDFEGRVSPLEEEYRPGFLAELDEDSDLLCSLTAAGFAVRRVTRRVFPSGAKELIEVSHSSLKALRKAEAALARSGVELYDVDVRIEQRFLASRGLLALHTDDERLEPLPLSVLVLRFEERSGSLKVLAGAGEKLWRVSGSEAEVATPLEELVSSLDPDVIASNLGLAGLKSLARRLRSRKDSFTLGRKGLLSGRVVVSEELLAGIGLEGLEERCWFSGLPPSLAGATSYGLLVEARQTYLLLSRGYAVPRRGNGNFALRTAAELHERDRGGLVRQPAPGVYENVAEIDFESMFPNIIVRFNVSYETVTREGVAAEPRGLLVDVVEPVLRRRLRFKRLAGTLGGEAGAHAELRQRELKMLLVSCYGYSGNSSNRLGNPLTFEWINRLARGVMKRVYEHVERKGYRVVYGDTDSVFVQKPGATPAEYFELAAELSGLTGLPVKLERVYKFIAFPEARSLRGAPLKRYFGVTNEGDLVIKGVEAARRDSPPVVKMLQREMIRVLFQAQSVEEVRANSAKALELALKLLERARAGELSVQDLAIEKTLRKRWYRATPPHLVAAMLEGLVKPGASVRYVPVSVKHPDPLKRVKPLSVSWGRYDRAYAAEVIARAAATILSPLGIKITLSDSGGSGRARLS